MQKDYTLYKADELLQDDYFLRSVKHPTPESQHFWEKQIRQNPALKEEIKLARLILSNLAATSSGNDGFMNQRIGLLKKQIDSRNKKHDHSSRNIRLYTVAGLVAAAVAILIFLNIPVQNIEESTAVDYESIARNFDSQAGDTDQIRLVLGEDQELIIEEGDVNIDYSQEDHIQLKSGDTELIAKKDEAIRFNQLFVPKGKRSSLILSDGTQVWVNSDSRMIYPERFAGEKREIYIEGEVYLNVRHDAGQPFIVKTSSLNVAVLGTEFNVSAYPEDTEQYIVLVNGQVEVEIPGRDVAVMRPEEKFTLDAIGPHVSSVDINEHVSWKSGYYQFRQEKLNRVFDKLNRFYGIDFSYTEQLQTLTCSGKLNLTDNIEEVLTILQKAAPIKVERSENTIYIDVKP
ncbi:MAG: FecR family protein [Tannerellaceae bacterium]|nr:FecR family protein [Tannerellaceae bacterium]